MKRILFILILLSWLGLILLSPYLGPYISRSLQKLQSTFFKQPLQKPKEQKSLIVGRKKIETALWFNGITLNSKLETQPGFFASQERLDPQSYRLDLALRIKVPQASRDLLALNSHLARQWPILTSLVSNATVSPFYEGLYQRKLDWLNTRLIRLDTLLSRHNFYDCDTILEITHNKQKLLFIQAEMDVVSDGSDPDRQIILPTNTANYQPFTSYRWPKRTTNQSPFLVVKEAKLKTYQTELNSTNVTPPRQKILLETIDQLKREIYDLQRYSYLVASLDRFIVLPGFMFRDRFLSHAPRVGDYAIVVYENRFYPAIVGDIGPSYKIGEASLALAQALNSKSTSYQRPVSNLEVSYLVFVNSAETHPSAPNPSLWRNRCNELLNELGPFSGTLECD